MSNDKLYKIECYIPESHLEAVKSAMFAAGAGRVGDYDSCAWQTPGQGQFRPMEGSTPWLGRKGKVETVAEYKVEMVCGGEVVREVVRAMKEAHPYEEVAHSVLRCEKM